MMACEATILDTITTLEATERFVHAWLKRLAAEYAEGNRERQRPDGPGGVAARRQHRGPQTRGGGEPVQGRRLQPEHPVRLSHYPLHSAALVRRTAPGLKSAARTPPSPCLCAFSLAVRTTPQWTQHGEGWEAQHKIPIGTFRRLAGKKEGGALRDMLDGQVGTTEGTTAVGSAGMRVPAGPCLGCVSL